MSAHTFLGYLIHALIPDSVLRLTHCMLPLLIWLLPPAVCSAKIVKSSKMASLMRENTAQVLELLVRVMDHPAKKARVAQ